MKKSEHYLLGLKGEAIAKKFLLSRKYKILACNYACHFGEIDIIAKDKKVLCFIEIKTRASLDHGYPAEAVTSAKQKKIIKSAEMYLLQNNIEAEEYRFDVLEILYNKENENFSEINLIKDAFELQE